MVSQCQIAPILIIDDDAFNSYALSSIFVQLGFECEAVQNGNQAIDLVNWRISEHKDVFDLIITSHKMQVHNEMKAMQTIRTITKDTGKRQPYICLLSADISTSKKS